MSRAGWGHLWALMCVAALAVGCTRANPDFFPDEGVEPPDPPPTLDAGSIDGAFIGGDRGVSDASVDPDMGEMGDAEPPVDAEMQPDAAREMGAEPDAMADVSLPPPDMGPVDEDDDGVPLPDDCDDGDPLVYPGAIELCDGRDNDCDDDTDEGWSELGLGEPCVVGRGACRNEGTRVCAESGEELRCSADPQAPMDEVCNQADDDCDGSTDEGLAGCCVPGDVQPCGSNSGACVEGQVVCDDAGLFGPCEGAVGPADEQCNAVDDDCDGNADEGFGLGADCEVGEGACRRRGQIACVDAEGSGCDVEPGPASDELCNGVDDDCDGSTDEGLGLGEGCAVGVGACERAGRQVCGDGGAVVCDAEPGPAAEEACNGVDDDCDGTTDEDVGGGMPCRVGIGACQRVGMIACDANGLLACDVVAGEPVDEACNGVDDDCDGRADEGFGPLGDRCTVGQGICAADGALACTEDGQAIRCDAAPGDPQDERCNGLDDDCDGAVDNGLGLGQGCEAGQGLCRARGVQVCGEGGDVVCDAPVGQPVDEACNDQDDDCDGANDEGFELGAACQAGVGVCAVEGRRVCAPDGTAACDAQPGEPADEACNGVDDDCDGEVDEGVRNACGDCGPEPAEACNGEDDDCDEQTDEDTGLCIVPRAVVAAPDAVSGFGTHLVDAGDLDGDGVGDALVGAPGGDQGSALLLSGGRGAVVWTVGGLASLGSAVAAGDLDGDGVRELFVGAPTPDNGVVLQLDPAGGEVRRLAGDDGFRAGLVLTAADGAPWVAMGDPEANPSFFGPAGGLRVVTFADAGPQAVTLRGQDSEALAERLFAVPDFGGDGVPDLIATVNAGFDRGTRLFVNPPADQRTEPLNPERTGGSFGEDLAFGRLLGDDFGTIFAFGAHLTNGRRGGVYLYAANGEQLTDNIGGGGRNTRQAYRLAVLPRPEADRAALIVGAQRLGEVQVWLLAVGNNGVAIGERVAVQVQGAAQGFGQALAVTAAGPDGTRRLFIGEPDGEGGGRVHIYSVR